MKIVRHLITILILLLLLAACQTPMQPQPGPTATPLPLATFTTVPTAVPATPPPAPETPAPDTPAPADTPTAPPAPADTPAPATTSPPPAAPGPYDFADTPERLVGSYVNAINRKEYQRAYDYWEANPQSYADFAAGYAHTKSVMALVRLPVTTQGAAGSMYATVPTLLLSTRNNGARRAYHACYTLRRANPDVAGEPTIWRIYDATAKKAKHGGGWPFIKKACLTEAPLMPPAPYDMADAPTHLIASYIDAVNRQDFQRAYDYWENNPQSYSDFAAGYAHTGPVVVLVRLPVRIEGAAGNQYAKVAALLLEKRNGKEHNYKACYTLHRPNPAMTDTPDQPTPWKILEATAEKVPDGKGWRLAKGCQ